MEISPLGRTQLKVSRLGLGTMTFGEQNTAEEAFRLLDLALDHGVTLIDAAELYPIPPRAETTGRTEEIVGAWLKARRNRERIVLATKAAGPGTQHIRKGSIVFDRGSLRTAIEGSLKRLGTETIDLYQLHWPERKTNCFGRLGYEHKDGQAFTPFAEILDALAEHVRAGTIRAVGLSNETPWGLMSFLGIADRLDLPRMASIQNPYSLLNRSFEVGLAEVAIREDCGLLAYSPLGMGTLSGKYLASQPPPRARLSLFPHYQRYSNPQAVTATQAYVALARAHGLSPAAMAIAFAASRPFMTSVLLGATTPEQLEETLAAATLRLDRAVLDGLEAIHTATPNPAP
ncbi:MAG: NADP(H)-dependent aldo-keto reductase [Defluviicoccus sp.]|nr:NADP(H)-dependent aldo-keto reductase [Defluviicoccus sp.]